MKTELWKKLESINLRYEISDQGKLRKLNLNGTYRNLKGCFTNSNGNYHFHYIDGIKYYTHRLVMLAFVGECPTGQEVDHINRDALDNRIENLRYVTRMENCLRGEDITQAKLNETKVKAILYLTSIGGLKQKAIGELFGVTQSAISRIKRGKGWVHVAR
ncbi:MAG: hypothetical protein EOO50_05215 [Flavobacterium sp.]|uniref:HNH endonuclease n=1 Tax=Flavobacterium sp. TaxID=239 RepID=UPI0011FA4978|nr:HNH endonuclease [Flavobacterium sp.]RZJ67683.1 MAG: hypothetical protein EOO50_05215 [Flavobacterium sp.]